MRKLCFGVMFLASAWHVFGQQSLTITASRSIALQPDEVVFAVNVISGQNMGLDDVVATLAGSGITAADFVTVISSNSPQGPVFQWIFNLPTPFSKIKDTITSLTATQRTIAQNNPGLGLTFSVQGTQVSPQLQDSQSCPIPVLIADARAQAQKMANSAGVTVGPILALSDGGGSEVIAAPQVPILFPAPVIPATRLDPVTSPLPVYVNLLPNLPTPPLNCTIVVKFSVLAPQ